MSQENNNNNNTFGNSGRSPIFQWIANHLIAILIAISGATASYFTLKSDVKVNTLQIASNTEEIKKVRIESSEQARRIESAIHNLSVKSDVNFNNVTSRIDTVILQNNKRGS